MITRNGGEAGPRLQGGELQDRSSRPACSPNHLQSRLEQRIIALRVTRRRSPHRIALHLHRARSMVGRILARFQMPLLRTIDHITGLPVRRTTSLRSERARPGEPVHVDIKKTAGSRTVRCGEHTDEGWFGTALRIYAGIALPATERAGLVGSGSCAARPMITPVGVLRDPRR